MLGVFFELAEAEAAAEEAEQFAIVDRAILHA